MMWVSSKAAWKMTGPDHIHIHTHTHARTREGRKEGTLPQSDNCAQAETREKKLNAEGEAFLRLDACDFCRSGDVGWCAFVGAGLWVGGVCQCNQTSTCFFISLLLLVLVLVGRSGRSSLTRMVAKVSVNMGKEKLVALRCYESLSVETITGAMCKNLSGIPS